MNIVSARRPKWNSPFCGSIAFLIGGVVLGCFVTARAQADPPSLFNMFGKKTVAAEPSKTYTLTEEEGPWLILAGNFAGPEGKLQADKLVQELRSDYDLAAFIYSETFDFSGRVADLQTGTKNVRYANPQAYESFSVLVGEFDTVNHPDIERTLATIKAATPKAFNMKGQENGPLSAVKKLHRQLLGQKSDGPKGPMANAFVTRNPLLPEDFFQQPEVDSFVMGMNKDVEYSLLDNPGKFTVVVCTFEGLSALVDGKNDRDFTPSADRLNEYARKANKMVTKLREQGVEAYEFHDRRRSLVAVGSFDNLGVQNVNGGFQYDPAILDTMQRYSAGDTIVRTPTGQLGLKAEHVDGIPYDLSPKPIAVPKKSKRSLYTATMDALGR
ncbi:hypothetical protein FF011L_36320 [Roseimaritima multifibrata]|uniref:Uncharacterized protein n=2 Tax=Roseimaritima multifibrata TaxID=1930274 RepID=A0A517MJ29_9BACT|nr:hypothetical protein FF011L_36320 [Roseimaritima multifibrata]